MQNHPKVLLMVIALPDSFVHASPSIVRFMILYRPAPHVNSRRLHYSDVRSVYVLIPFLLVWACTATGQYSISTNGITNPQFDTPIDVTLGVDELSPTLDIGFDFTFFGQIYSDFVISSNGFLSFQTSGESGSIPQIIPDTTDPNNLVALGWGALIPDYIYVTYETIGTAPYRSLHVNFFVEDYEEPPCASGYVLSGQIILFETTNIIEIHTDYWDGGDCNLQATQGIENEDGTTAFSTPGRNNALWSASESFVKFIPDDYTDLAVTMSDPVLCAGTRDIRVQVQNVGGATVDTFYMDWIWDGVPQDSINVFISLPPNSITQVVLGQKTLSTDTSYLLNAWSYDPENEPDHFTTNDTISGTVKGGLEGIYTIGGTSPDFVTIGDAITSLVNSGVCDSVVFNIRPGTYSEELDIPNLTIAPGAVIIFQSETNDSDDVTITRHYTSGSANRLIDINNTSHLRFNALTLKVTGTVCASAVYMNSYCTDIFFTGCHISGPTCNSTSTSGALISMVNGQKEDIRIEHNTLRKGSYGVYVSPGSFSFAYDITITDNSIDSFYTHGIFLNRTDGLTVTGNTIFSTTTTAIGIEANTTYGVSFLDRNSVYLPVGTYGIRLYRHNFNAPPFPDTMFVFNNMINLGGTVSGSRSMSVEQNLLVNIWHNTLVNSSTQSTSYGFYSTSNTLTDFRNSIITHFGSGRAAWMTSITSDHNAFYSASPPLISNGTNFNLLDEWVLASGMDQNSIQADPAFVSSTDLHIKNAALNNAGDTLTPPVTIDFDQEVRTLLAPDIGADEIGFFDDDLIAGEILLSNNGVTGENEVTVTVYNIGTNDVNDYTLQWKVNDSVYTSVTINDPIHVGGGDTIVLGTVHFDPGVEVLIRANTHMPNGEMDNDMTNDTAWAGPFYPLLSGLYTVGGMDPDFTLLSQAFEAIALGGIADSVNLAVRDGLYADPINLTGVAAFNCAKPVKVFGESQDASEVIFDNDNEVAPVIRLNGVHGISFRHMTFQLTPSAFHNVVILENGASCNRFDSCVFNGRITTQTSSSFAVVLCSSNQGVDNDFYHNTFQLGSIGLSTTGPNLPTGSLVDIVGNTFLNNYAQGLGVTSAPFVHIRGNHSSITSAQHSGYNGMFANNCKSMVMSHNAVYNPFVVTGSSLGFTECDGTFTDTTKVYNNFVYSGTSNNLSSIFGGSYSNYIHISNNTSRSHQGRAAGFSWCSNFRLDNNIFTCMGTGLTLELLNMQGTDVRSDNNCLYAPNGSIGELQNVIYPSMAEWQALGYDTTSLNVNPLFNDLSFHPYAAILDQKAIPYTHITDDYEGDPRDPVGPDIGADEFEPLTADAGMLALLHPTMPFAAGLQPVYVRFYNNSGDTLQSVQFNWEVNGSAQPSFIWNGLLPSSAVYDSLEIGQFEFESFTPYLIKAWVSEPNGMADQLAINDTIEVQSQYAGLAGIYAIGGSDPDFETITEAVAALNAGGAAAPVTFNIRSGVYAEPMLIHDFPGSDCNRPVIFQSESGDATEVTITNLGINAHTIVLNGADGIHFKDLTITSVNTSFRHVVLFSGGAHCNHFEGNTFKGFQSTATANTSAVIRSTAGLDTANVFIQNHVDDGSYSFHLTGNGGAITHTVISGNHMEPYYRGIYNSAFQGVTISHNTIITDNHPNGAGLEIYTGHNLNEISYNTILAPIGAYGIGIDNCDNTNNNRGRIYNNSISVGGTGIARGISLTGGCAYQDLLHNSVLVYSTNGTLANTAPLYLTSNSNLRILNNALKNDGPGYAIYANANTSFVADNNDYFTDGATFGYWNGGAVETTFANWQTASMQDTHSLNVDPNFMSNTDLHTFLVLLDGAGDPAAGIPDDYDGEPRDSLPDIGADEFDPLPSNDAGIFMFAGPHIPFAADTLPVHFVIKNFGGNPLTSATVRWAVNGIEQPPFDWTGNLPSAVCDTIQIGTFPFEELIAYNIDAWTEMPNDTTDADPENDVFSTGIFYASLAGSYTVGGFAPDFNLVSELETILNTAGIVGNVTFNFRPGIYTEAISISKFPRISYAHIVTFQSETGDSTDVTLTQSTNNTVLLDLDDAHRITFKHFTLLNTKGHVLQIRNGSSLISVENNHLEGLPSLSSARSLIYSPSTTEDSISILNNVLRHGYYGIYFYGGTFEKRHIIQGNTFLGNFHIGMYLRAFDGPVITGNVFNASSTGSHDLYVYNGTGVCTIQGNRIISDNSQISVVLSTLTNTSPNTSTFANNFIYKSGTSNYDAVHAEVITKMNFDFNSIYNNMSHSGSAALYTNTLTTCNIRNNILYSISGAAHHHVGTMPAIHNYNAIFSLGSVQVQHGNNVYATLAAFAAATSSNANSKAVDPFFISTIDPDVTQYMLHSAGVTVSGLTTDIDGMARTSPPDIGAKEFTPIPHDVRLSHILTPEDGCGLSATEPVTIILVNQGSIDATGFDVHYQLDQTIVTENIGSEIVPAGDSLSFTFLTPADVEAYATYAMSSWHTYSQDLRAENDTVDHSFTNFPPFMEELGNLIPAYGTSGLENQVSLSWSPVDHAVHYDLYLWPSTGSKPMTPSYGNLTNINQLASNLTYGTTYLWQVHAKNICGEQIASDTSSFSVRVLPDLIVSSIIIPATGISEQVIGVEWNVTNQGAGLTIPGIWYDNIYLSVDPTYNSFDVLLGSVPNLTSLNPSQSYAHSANVTLPQGTNGNYYIIIKTDHYNSIKETDNNNNTSYSSYPIQVTLSPPPDLIVTEVNTPLLTFSGQTINISYEVRNIGSGITTDNIWKDDITLQPVPGNSNGITLLLSTRTHTGYLQPDSVYNVNLQVAIPHNIWGDHQIKVFTDSKQDVFEFASEGNNTFLSNPFEIVLTPPADLVVDSLIVPDTISLYKKTPINFQIKNQGGSAPTVGWSDRYYLSQSPVFNTNFLTHLGYAYHNAGLMPGSYNEKTVEITLNGDYTGVYYLYVITDHNHKVNEFEFENNNILRSDPFVITRPDLKPDSLIHPANAMSGSVISVRTEVINSGPGHFGGTYVNRYYLSQDTILSTMTDMLLTSRTISNVILSVTDTISNSFNLTLPPDQFGARHMICHTDAPQSIFEGNEENNVLSAPIMIFEAPHADLISSDLASPDTITAGVAFDFEYTLSNTGDMAINTSVTDSLFLSFSSSWNRSTAVPLGTRVLSQLDTAQSTTFLTPLETNINQNSNFYYIYVVSDATQKVYEGSGEGNNVQRSAQIVLLSYPDIDLKLDSITGVSDTLLSGTAYPVQYVVSNLSNAPTYYSAWSDRYYFSTDSVFQPAQDMWLGTLTYDDGSLDPESQQVVQATLTLPDGISGDYYLFIEADSEDLHQDPDRANNADTYRPSYAAKKIHVKLALYPDLQPTSFVCPVEIVSGQYFNIITTVMNGGPGLAKIRTDKLFVSTNNTIEQGDYTLASLNKNNLTPAQSQTDTVSVFVPANFQGNYFIIYSVDHGNKVFEHTGEANNILISSIIATPPPPADLIVKNILVPDSILAGETASITWETKNQGANPATGQFREIVYLSPDTTWNLADEVIGVWDGSVSLAPGSASTKTVDIAYNNVKNDDYHTIIRTDARNNIPESNENNNDGYSFDLTNVDIKEIFLNQTEETFLTVGVNRYYKLLIEAENAGRNILITLTGDTVLGVNQMFVKFESVPTAADHDYAYQAPFYPHQQIMVRNAQPGYYYILVNGNKTGESTPQAIALMARPLLMEILDVTPNKGGNKGFTTIEAFGSELDSIITVKLVRADTLQEYYEIVADTFIMMDEGSRVIARFNLEGQPLADYHLLCLRESIWMASYSHAFEIIEGTGSEIQLHWDFNPKSFNPRFTTIFQIKVDVENTGDADAEDRFIRVGAPEYDNPMYYSLNDYYNQIVHDQLVLAAEDLHGFPGILRPGGRRTFYVFGRVGGTQGFSIQYDK